MTNKRSIFEEVGSAPKPAMPAQGDMIDAGRRRLRGPVRAWLIGLFILVTAMIAVGGLTRLTDSGLSITEWRPLTGAMPPTTNAEWEAEFALYRASPEYQLQNSQMDITAFKRIYWWEWGHRQLGRVIGLVWAVGFVVFLATRRMPPGWTGRLLLLGLLGGLQGAIGWWMVASGLTGPMVDVASYRLALHLGLAFTILGLIAWQVLMLARGESALMQARRAGDARLAGLAGGVACLAFVQILLGALVAGIDAGRAFPTWPLMGDSFFPADALYLPEGGPVWRAFFENPGLVQFIHRLAGYGLFATGIAVWLAARRSAHAATRGAFALMLAMLVAQVALGIITVLHAAPLALGLVHQLGAVALWVLILRARHRALYPVVQSIRGTK